LPEGGHALAVLAGQGGRALLLIEAAAARGPAAGHAHPALADKAEAIAVAGAGLAVAPGTGGAADAPVADAAGALAVELALAVGLGAAVQVQVAPAQAQGKWITSSVNLDLTYSGGSTHCHEPFLKAGMGGLP